MLKINKIGAAVVGLGLALALIAGVAAPVANAQAMTLSQLVDLFISLGIIAPDKAAAAKSAVTSSASASFSRDLTVGSSGADVTALQNALAISPATGYFGALTKAAVQKYQASKGIPATGFVGPLTRAELNKGSAVATPSTPSTVVNTGVEGTLTVTKAAVSNTTAYEGDSMRTVLALKAEAKVSDIAVQRVKLDLGTSTSVYTKVYRTMYLVDDAGRVLAQADLNSNTVVKDGNNYYLTLGGFSYVVPRDSSKILSVKADLYSSIDSGFETSRSISLANNGVRGVDGAGIDQYSPITGSNVSQSISISSSLIDSAAATLSINSSNFKTTEVIASEGSDNDEYDRLALGAFDIKASKDNLLVTDIDITITKGGSGTATTSTVYLMDGSNVISTDSVNADGTATFDNIDVSIAKDATKTFVVKADIRQANATVATFALASVNPALENSVGDSVTESGSASGETMYVRNIGPMFTLISKSISKSQSAEINQSSTTTVKATFDLKIKALGGAISFDGQSASTTFGFRVYKDGALFGTSVSSSTSFVKPSTGVLAYGSNGFTLQEENEITIPVETVFIGNNLALGSYAVGLESVAWRTGSTDTSSTFMAGNVDWRTSTVQLP